jgi:hypothetical protein
LVFRPTGIIVRLQHKAFELFADYHPFYLWDRGMNRKAPVDYKEEDVQRRVKPEPHVFVIQPERNRTVAVEIEVHDAEPAYNSDEWDHIAEARSMATVVLGGSLSMKGARQRKTSPPYFRRATRAAGLEAEDAPKPDARGGCSDRTGQPARVRRAQIERLGLRQFLKRDAFLFERADQGPGVRPVVPGHRRNDEDVDGLLARPWRRPPPCGRGTLSTRRWSAPPGRRSGP